ncbi:Uncharacterised protein [Mycobacterium tuberculosis]|nr:Uncharacterised protein [Mycobacterium tuberculosis]
MSARRITLNMLGTVSTRFCVSTGSMSRDLSLATMRAETAG